MSKPPRIQRGMRFSGDDGNVAVGKLIATIWSRFDDKIETGTSGRSSMTVKGLHGRIIQNLMHLQNDPRVAPKLPEPYEQAETYQTDVPRRVWKDLKARVTENLYTVDVQSAHGYANGDKDADDAQTVFTQILQQIEQRHGFSWQDDMSDGQIASAAAMLHWWRNEQETPDAPDYDELDELSEAQQKSGNYTEDDYAPYENDQGKTVTRTKSKKYRETEDAYATRVAKQQALAGVSYDGEVLPLEACAWQEDRSCANGLARVVVRRHMGFIDYRAEVNGISDETVVLSEQDIDADSDVHEEVAAPEKWEPSGDNWGDTITVFQLWTRDEFYEIVADSDAPGAAMRWEIVKAFKHEWEHPPFYIVKANYFNTPDPANAYQPALEGVYRIKPHYDYLQSLLRVVSESIALPLYYLERVPGMNAPPGLDLDAQGALVVFTRNALGTVKPPDGYRIAQLQYQLNPAMVQAVEGVKQDLIDAMPSTGKAEFAPATAPWAARLQQAQEAIEPGKLIVQQQAGLQFMVRDIAKDISRRGRPEYVFGSTSNGALDMSTVVGVEPEQIESLNITVTIGKVTESERLTTIQVDKELLDDPLFPIFPRVVIEHMGEDNPSEYEAEWNAFRAYETEVRPGRTKQLVAQTFGTDFALGPNGAFIAMNGQQVTPEQVLQANGVQPLPNGQTQNAAGGQNIGTPNGVPQTSMGQLPELQAPGTMPMQGVAG